MNRGDKPDVVIWHGPTCFDGHGAAWAIWQQWPDVEFIPAQYGDELPLERCAGKGVLIVDFSYPEGEMRRLAAEARWVVVLDHHKTAEADLRPLLAEGVVKGEFDMNRSGARMAWAYAWGVGNPPKLIQHIEDRDLWRFQLDGTREISAALGSIEMDFRSWTEFARRLEEYGGREKVLAEGAAILRTRDKEIRQILDSSARLQEVAGVKVFVANVPYHLASEAGHLLGKARPFAAVYFDRADGMRQWSLRSSEEGADVSEIAKSFGGGGHQHAAGFSMPMHKWPTADGAGRIPLNSGVGHVEVVTE